MARTFYRILLYCSICSLLMIAGAAGIVWKFRTGLPSFDELENVEPAQTTNVYSADGKVLRRFFVQNREPVSYDDIAPSTIDALIAVEDQNFWRHWGVSIPDIFRAVARNLVKEGSLKGHGASTITQQLARNLFLDQEVTWSRKIKEQLTAVLLERTYTKREIIEMYFNQMLFGNGAHGIQSAAERFFRKDAKDLAVEESALLVGLLKSPYYYSPITYPKRAEARRNLVLRQMWSSGRISLAERRSAEQRPIILKRTEEVAGEAPYFTEHIRRNVESEHGVAVLYQDGADVFTTLDSRLQEIAEKELKHWLTERQWEIDNQRRRNPPDSTFWAGMETHADSMAATAVQGALVAIDPRNGHVLAMVGGRDFAESKFNRAVQALRQPGSAFKPIIYTAAVDRKIPPTERLPDTAVSIPMQDGTVWQPENYDRRFLGWMTLRQGLARSRNVVTTQLVQRVGPRKVVEYARKFGFTTRIRPVLSLGMGTSEVKLIDLVSAYGVFPNHGIRVEPTTVLRIVDKDGNVLEDRLQGKENEVLSVETAAVMTSLLQSVMDDRNGTGYGARRDGFKRPAGGKTGTTQNFADAWFVGFTPQIVAGVWIGFDAKVSLGSGKSGATMARPVWTRFMKQAHEVLGLDVEDFEIPSGVAQVEVCGDTYQVASIYCPKRLNELFVPGSAPKRPCPTHTAFATPVRNERESREEKRKSYQF